MLEDLPSSLDLAAISNFCTRGKFLFLKSRPEDGFVNHISSTSKISFEKPRFKWDSESQGDLIWHGEEEIAAYTVTDESPSFPRGQMFDVSTSSIWHSTNKSARVIINFKVRIEKKTRRKKF